MPIQSSQPDYGPTTVTNICKTYKPTVWLKEQICIRFVGAVRIALPPWDINKPTFEIQFDQILINHRVFFKCFS